MKELAKATSEDGLKFERHFTRDGLHPFKQVKWDKRVAEIKDWTSGKVAFRQEDLQFPDFWSQRAIDVVASKYFRGHLGKPGRENSLKQLVGRIVDTISTWGEKMNYFASQDDATTFNHELTHILLHQMAAFNSPVQFNVGIKSKPQCSACFINSVEDSMESIMKLARTEATIFKGGSGSGINLSRIRSSKEPLKVGGFASGPISFMRGYDSFAGAIKSGGATRRAAKMVILNADHPDVEKFIWCKAREEQKAQKLIELGYDDSIDGEAYSSIQFQNANNSVSVTDEFMEAVVTDGEWNVREVTTGEIDETYSASEMMDSIARAAWICGDPGLQFHSTINDWHTCPSSDEIRGCNPCSEYVFLDNSACNLSSINLIKFGQQDGSFDIEGFKHTVRTMITAQEIIVDNASYPTPEIEEISHEYRTLGLGYANLGAYLMSRGLPYDSEGARNLAAVITAVMTGEAYLTSAEIAREKEPFLGFDKNRVAMMRVMHKHRDALSSIDSALVPMDLLHAAMDCWDEAIVKGSDSGYRNAQVTLLAPTGTIAFMMDCDTTGIEPDFSLVKVKKLVGGGTFKIINNTIPLALRKLGYSDEQITTICEYVEEKETIEGAPQLNDQHLPVFDCADRTANGERSIHHLGHIRMCGAVQPFLSGAISKTVNLPNEATVTDIRDAYIQGWKYGMKSISVYRDGGKMVQPLSNKEREESATGVTAGPIHRNMPKDHPAYQHEFRIKGFKGFLTMGLYPEDAELGEIFVNFAKQGSTLQGMAMAWAIAISMGLQRGVPLEDYVRMFAHMSFEPGGFTDNPQIPFATSIPDYVVRYLASKFMPEEAQEALGIHGVKPNGSIHDGVQINFSEANRKAISVGAVEKLMADTRSESAACHSCGNLMQRNGNCYVCTVCGATSGCS